MRISVIVPVLDEAARIGASLDALRDQGFAEVIVVDGGSTDDTLALARVRPFVRVLGSARGRAAQLNAGARAAEGDVLLFLHADVALPDGAARLVAETLDDAATVAGAFRTWHVAATAERAESTELAGGRGPTGGAARLGPLLHLADLRSRYTGLPYGDQALFVRREAFERAGGYPEQPLMEDLELSRRLRRLGRIARVPACVRVSGRRFLAHPLRAALAANFFPLLYRLGVSPAALRRLYPDVR